MSYLYERPDFGDLIEAAADFHGIANPAIVEKDYYVTEALRLVAQDFGRQVIFKGGTSLAKGWKLINRFSNDIDLYIDPAERGSKARNALLKELATSVDRHPMLTIDEASTQRINGVARATTYNYQSGGHWAAASPTVLLETGIQSGTFPTEQRKICPLLSELLTNQGVGLNTDELDPFILPLRHFRRTFAEKLYALHRKIEQCVLKDGAPIGGYARHYYDVSQLLQRSEVQVMLDQHELVVIARDYRRLTRLCFPRQLLPPGMNLHDSKALFPRPELKASLSSAYIEQCDTLCYGKYPSFDEVLDQFMSVRDFLQVDLARIIHVVLACPTQCIYARSSRRATRGSKPPAKIEESPKRAGALDAAGTAIHQAHSSGRTSARPTCPTRRGFSSILAWHFNASLEAPGIHE